MRMHTHTQTHTHKHTHCGSRLAVNDLDEIDLATGQMTVCAVHPSLINTSFTVDLATS